MANIYVSPIGSDTTDDNFSKQHIYKTIDEVSNDVLFCNLI